MAVDPLAEAKVAALVALADHGISPDVQELLVAGDGRGNVAPGAFDKAVRAIASVVSDYAPPMRPKRDRSVFIAELEAVGLDTRTKNALLNSHSPVFGALSDVLRTRRSELSRIDGIGNKALDRLDALAVGTSFRDWHNDSDATTLWQLALGEMTVREMQARREGHTTVANELAYIISMMKRRKPNV